MLLSEIDLGGTPVDLALRDDGSVYAILMGTERDINPTRVVWTDLRSPPKTATILDSRDVRPGFYHAGLAMVGPYLLVGDRTPGHESIVAIDGTTQKEVGRISAGLYPPVALRAVP